MDTDRKCPTPWLPEAIFLHQKPLRKRAHTKSLNRLPFITLRKKEHHPGKDKTRAEADLIIWSHTPNVNSLDFIMFCPYNFSAAIHTSYRFLSSDFHHNGPFIITNYNPVEDRLYKDIVLFIEEMNLRHSKLSCE